VKVEKMENELSETIALVPLADVKSELLPHMREAYPAVSIELIDDHVRVCATGPDSEKTVNQIVDELISVASDYQLGDVLNSDEDDLVEEYFGAICRSSFERDLVKTRSMLSEIVENSSIEIKPCGNEDLAMVLLKYSNSESASESIGRFVHELIREHSIKTK
jgi:hypothetical protein